MFSRRNSWAIGVYHSVRYHTCQKRTYRRVGTHQIGDFVDLARASGLKHFVGPGGTPRGAGATSDCSASRARATCCSFNTWKLQGGPLSLCPWKLAEFRGTRLGSFHVTCFRANHPLS